MSPTKKINFGSPSKEVKFEMSSKENDSTPRYGIEVPLQQYERGDLGGYILQHNHYEDFFIRGSRLSFFLEDLRNKVQLNKSQFATILERDQGNYYRVLKGKGGIKLPLFINLPNHPTIQNKLGIRGLGYVKNAVSEILIDPSSIIYRSTFKINFSLENLEQRRIEGVDYVILPTNLYEVRGGRARLKEWVLKYYKDNKIAPKSTEFLKEFPTFLNVEREYNRTWNDFLKECGITPRHDWTYDWSDQKNIEMVEKWVKKFHREYGRSPTYNEVQAEFGSGFHGYWRKVLGKTYNQFLQNLNLPLTYEMEYDWSDPAMFELVEDWVEVFFNEFGRVPSTREVTDKFSSGVFDVMRRMNTTWTQFLEKKGYPRLRKEMTDWSNPENVQEVENYVRNYFDQNGVSPPETLMIEVFGGFITSMRNRGVLWNDFLRSLGLPPRFEMQYDWSDPVTFEIVRKWAIAFYKKYGDSPSRGDFYLEGFGSMLGIKRLNEFLEECGLPTRDMERSYLEGNLFDVIGKKSFQILHPNSLVNYLVYHPDFEGDYIIPDIIIHDFGRSPIKLKGKSIKMKRGEKLDEIIDFKRSYGSLKPKVWAKYPKVAKKIKFYLLKEGTKIQPTEQDGCKISFHSKNELIQELREKRDQFNEERINTLIRKITLLDKGITDFDRGQQLLDEF